MPRIPPIITVNVHVHATGDKYKVEVLPTPWAGKYRVRLNRRNSTRFDEGTISEIFNRLRRMVVALTRRDG